MKKSDTIKAWILISGLLTANCFFNSGARGQDSIYNLYGIYAHHGFIIPHSYAIRDVSGSNPSGIEFNLNRLNTSLKSRSVFSGYWLSGIQAAFFSFRNPDILGSAFMLTAYAEPLIIRQENILFSVRGGGGLSYHTKIYNETENPLNQFFCTRISFPVYVSARFRLRVKPGLYLNISGNYNHISNGGMKQPNYGMNFPTISAGAEYAPVSIPSLKGRTVIIDDNKSKPWRFSVQGLMSYKVVDKTELFPEKGTIASGLHLKVTRRMNYHYALSIGSEFISDRSFKEIIKRGQMGIDHNRLALTAGQDFLLGRVAFGQHIGIYLYYPYRARDPFYQKYELAYFFPGRISAGLFMKAHTYEAELMGITLSYRLAGR